ncbi:MAG: hypothetical protein NC231_13795 [Bacillus sp. (in: Bacteria)]|nr:hypothetical protein [Bacillus sp. (in: firmicutes)]MCM1425336.1 hypothetical protein [Eubacterium sp.]
MNEQNVKTFSQTPMTKQMKSQVSFFAPASMLYALFYTFCLYKNASGITYSFFVVGTLCYFFLSMKKLGVPFKKSTRMNLRNFNFSAYLASKSVGL